MAEWTPEEDADLFRMWNREGLSASLCAQNLPGRSRNSVIGRVNRMGWNRPQPSDPDKRLPYPERQSLKLKFERARGRGNSPGSRASLAIGQRKAKSIGKEAVEINAGDIPSPDAKPWFLREWGQCAFPVSGEGADVLSCCNPTGGETYCLGHAAIVYKDGTAPTVYAPASDTARRPKSRDRSIFSSWLEDAA